MMTPEQLNAIKERLAKATPGPWGFDKGDNLREDRRPAVVEHFDYEHGEWFIHGDIADISDATFIAHARQDIPALVAEIERLRAELTDIIVVATEEASSITHDNGYDDIVAIARSALK
ncbi:hypothetical protein ACQKNX_24550 [Lysinibacillus sp. NPDC093712]|uniref:hypothetical protein n=1 Tax=Lysinibacillus sp. NPDC093712 TaxID=3390579 RepID=UPI003D01D1A2